MRDLVCTCRGEWPNTSIWPFVGYSNPSSNLTVVDLPEPFGPSNPNTSPRRTSKSTLSTARALGRPQKSLKTLVSPRTETMTSPLECGVDSVRVMAGLIIRASCFPSPPTPPPRGGGRETGGVFFLYDIGGHPPY